MNIEGILKIKVDEGTTINDYLFELLHRLWLEGESFSGKRPFGNSGWEYDLYASLVRANAIHGRLDSEGNILSFDKVVADKIIFKAIYHIFGKTT